jgi:succinyl-diaminopimelate desuccinylase
MSHGAMPLSGLNTAPGIAKLISRLHDMEVRAVKNQGRDENLGWPSFTPTVIQAPASGAPQLNVMPGEARILVDIRTIPGQSHPAIIDDLTGMADETEREIRHENREYDNLLGLQRKHDLKIKLDLLTDRPCTLTERNEPVVLAADWATRQVTSRQPEYSGVPGATNGTFLWALKNIPIVTMGAGDRQVPHQVNEWIDLEQLVETAKIYALTALYYLQP